MSDIRIDLDKLQYYPGDIITGKAVCNFRSSKDVRKIRIRLKGNEYTHWTETESYYDSQRKEHKSRTVSYEGDRDFLLLDEIVHGEGTLGPGRHVFPFEFRLRENLPGTFQHSYGRIAYWVKATVDRPWKTDLEDKRVFTMISLLKLSNLPSHYHQPTEYSDDKTICCFCCASGPIELNFKLEKQAFVIGERVDIETNCLNMSNVNVDSLDAVMKMEIIFRTTSPSTKHKYDSELVASSYNSGVGAHGEKNCTLVLEIPPSTMVPNFSGCELFSCNTELKVTAVISGCHSNIDISTRVALGHVPYLQQVPIGDPLDGSAPPYPTEETIGFSIHNSPGYQQGHMPMPMPMPTPTPMYMPMPVPEYGTDANKISELPPYPSPGYPSGPSAPQEVGAPSAPPKGVLSENPFSAGAGNTSTYELPPPSYEEAAKKN